MGGGGGASNADTSWQGGGGVKMANIGCRHLWTLPYNKSLSIHYADYTSVNIYFFFSFHEKTHLVSLFQRITTNINKQMLQFKNNLIYNDGG